MARLHDALRLTRVEISPRVDFNPPPRGGLKSTRVKKIVQTYFCAYLAPGLNGTADADFAGTDSRDHTGL